jgi:hypothetical protein
MAGFYGEKARPKTRQGFSKRLGGSPPRSSPAGFRYPPRGGSAPATPPPFPLNLTIAVERPPTGPGRSRLRARDGALPTQRARMKRGQGTGNSNSRKPAFFPVRGAAASTVIRDLTSAHTGCVYRQNALNVSRAVTGVRGAAASTVIMDLTSAHTGCIYLRDALAGSRAAAGVQRARDGALSTQRARMKRGQGTGDSNSRQPALLPAGERGGRTPDPTRKYENRSGDRREYENRSGDRRAGG